MRRGPVAKACGTDVCSETIHESVDKADQKIKMQIDNIAGVMLPEFALFKDTQVKTVNILPGLAKGGEAVIKAKSTFQSALELLVALAGLQTSFMLLDEAIKVWVKWRPCCHATVLNRIRCVR